MSQAPYSPQDIEIICQSADIRAMEITLAPRFDTPEHHHSEVEEICYCLSGELTVVSSGESPLTLLPGQRKRLASGLPHQLRNRTESPCRFLLIHGVGKFDFVATKPPRRETF
jgi:quercetin dioxygenase-like cupin family protein